MKAKACNIPVRLIVFSAVISSIILISYLRVLDNYELETLDIRFMMRPAIATSNKVVFVDMGEDTIDKLGHFPLNRSYHAVLVKALSEAGARAIVFDIFFSEPSEHDKELEDAIKRAGNVYIPSVFDVEPGKAQNILTARGYLAKTMDYFTAYTKGTGHINTSPDPDGKFRRVPLYIKQNDKLNPYISFLVSCDYLGIGQSEVKFIPGKCAILPKGINIPLDERSNMIVNFSGKWGNGYKHYSYVDVLQSYLAHTLGQKPILDLKVFKDKVCIIGLTAAGTVDLHPTPFEPLYPGVGVHAEVFNSILNRQFIARATKAINLGILAVLAIFISIVTSKTRPTRGFLVLMLSMFVFIITSVILFNIFGIWVDIFVPILAMTASYFLLTVDKYINEWKKRLVMESELDIAKKIQESFLPKTIPATGWMDIATAMFTARKVGGDLYDFMECGHERVGIMVGDVSGKGVPASLFMAKVIDAFKFIASGNSGPKDALSALNIKLVLESSSNLFVTLFYAVFDNANKKMIYSNGGHLPVIYLGHGRDVEYLDVDVGTPLGLVEGLYAEKELAYGSGDIFVFYTDGVTEAMNGKGEMYDKERLAAVISSNRDLPSKAVLDAIEKDVRRFEPRSMQHDDITIIVVKIL